jgi:putative transposase
MTRPKQPPSPFRYFNSSPEVIRLVVMMYVKYPLSLRNVEDLLAERGIDVSYESVRFWWNRFGPMFAAEIRRKRVDRMRAFTHWRWHLDEVGTDKLTQRRRNRPSPPPTQAAWVAAAHAA